jgi:predicted dehydrogenase
LRPIRAAVIGGGTIAAVHRRAILAAEGASVAGVLGSDPARCRELAERWGTSAFDSIEALLEADLDVVHVCSPNATHLSYASAAIQAGLHVVCEKPLATTAQAAAVLVSAAAQAGVVATVPFVYRYHPLVRELRARRERGEFGRWYALHGSYLQDWMLSPGTTNWRVSSQAGGASRAFGDIGSHWCDLVEFVPGERFARVNAITSVAVHERPHEPLHAATPTKPRIDATPVGTEDIAIATFVTETAVPVSTVISQVAAGRRNRLWFELDGANGSAVFDQEQPETTWIGHADGASILTRGVGDLSDDQRTLSFLPGGHPQGFQDAFNAFVSDTYRAIRGDRPSVGLPTFADGLRAVQIVDAVLVSAAHQEWSAIPPRR